MTRLKPVQRFAIGLLALLGGMVVATGRTSAHEPGASTIQAGQDIPGGLEGGVDWINTSGPIHLSDLRGKVVLLDFWTYCCINCHHILPDLEYLEKKFPNELVVIGVHTAKFYAEKETDNIRKKVAEYRIKHPVINDANQVLWNRFGVESWPTLVLIDARGQYQGAVAGEGQRDLLEKAISRLIAEHKERNELNTEPIKFFPENEKPHNGPLLFPGKVTADADGKRLFVTDTGHNRIVMTDLNGRHLATIGAGPPGRLDGPYEKALFNRPQGTCLHQGKLYVADTENHAIREIDLEAKTVKTVAGTGEQGYERFLEGNPGGATETALSSPWDVAPVSDNKLAIAMAGAHQIWLLDLKERVVYPWVGSGKENVCDGLIARGEYQVLHPEKGKRRPVFGDTETALAQPSGLAVDKRFLYVADSEGSAVRSINLNRDDPAAPGKGQFLDTIAGTHDLPEGQSLFAFGDRDGRQTESLLQHCLGLAYADGKVYVADTYNNKIKVIQTNTRTVETLAGSRNPGSTDNPAQFDEPGGLSIAGDLLYVADTNNHAIRVIDRTSRQVRTLTLEGVEPPKSAPSKPRFPNPTLVKVEETKLAPANRFQLVVDINLPEGFEVNPEAPMPALLEATDTPELLGPALAETGFRIDPPRAQFDVEVPLRRTPAAGEVLNLKFSLSVFECKKAGSGLCRVRNLVWQIPVKFEAGGAGKVMLTNVAPAK